MNIQTKNNLSYIIFLIGLTAILCLFLTAPKNPEISAQFEQDRIQSIVLDIGVFLPNQSNYAGLTTKGAYGMGIGAWANQPPTWTNSWGGDVDVAPAADIAHFQVIDRKLPASVCRQVAAMDTPYTRRSVEPRFPPAFAVRVNDVVVRPWQGQLDLGAIKNTCSGNANTVTIEVE